MTKIRTGPPVASLFALLSAASFGLFTQRREAERFFMILGGLSEGRKPVAVPSGAAIAAEAGTFETIPTIMKGPNPLT